MRFKVRTTSPLQSTRPIPVPAAFSSNGNQKPRVQLNGKLDTPLNWIERSLTTPDFQSQAAVVRTKSIKLVQPLICTMAFCICNSVNKSC